MSEKELVSRIYKKFSRLKSKKSQTIQWENWQKTFHRRGHPGAKIGNKSNTQKYLSLGKYKLKWK